MSQGHRRLLRDKYTKGNGAACNGVKAVTVTAAITVRIVPTLILMDMG